MIKTVFIAHPISGAIRGNIEKVLKICEEVHIKDLIPVAPYIISLQYLNDDIVEDRKLGMEANMVKQLARVAMAAKNSSLLTDSGGAPCNAPGTTTSQQFACAVSAMARVMNSYVTSDPTKAANMIAALNAQSPTAVDMPVRKADGTMTMQMTDMTSSMSIQTAMQNAGMTATTASNTGNVMMGRMM